MDTVKNAANGIKSVYRIASTDPPRTLRALSTGSGVLLVIGGFAGIFTINPLSLVISVYNMLFGLLIVVTELKSWPVIRTFQKRVDVYFHLLSVPRGKGGFYCFIGFLAFFSSDWSLARVCVLIVSIVGLLHLLMCKRCGAPGEGEGEQQVQTIQSIEAGGTDGGLSWGNLMKQVVTESPEMLAVGVSALAGKASEAGSSGGGSSGTSINARKGDAIGAPSPPGSGLPQASNMTN